VSDPDDRQEPAETQETVNRESHPNASGPAGLAGDMGLSSERQGPFEGIEATGSTASAQETTDGESPTVRVEHAEVGEEPGGVDKPDATSPDTGVDRTVGEVKPDPVANKHEFDPGKNPRH
jgi:hypothetical protein